MNKNPSNAMQNRAYNGLVQRAPDHVNTAQLPNLYAFSGTSVIDAEPFTCVFRAIPVFGFISPAEFAKDVHSLAPLPLPGMETVFAPDWHSGMFVYHRQNGAQTSMRVDNVKPITPEELLGETPPVGKKPKSGFDW